MENSRFKFSPKLQLSLRSLFIMVDSFGSRYVFVAAEEVGKYVNFLFAFFSTLLRLSNDRCHSWFVF